MAMSQKTALVVRGGWEGHRPVEATDMFVPYLEDNGFTVKLADSPAPYADAELMAGVDLIMQCYSMGTIERDQFEGLERAVRFGSGFAGWHGGIADSYRNTSDYLHLVGGQFACHPGKDPAVSSPSEPDHNFVPYRGNMLAAAREHPVTQGIEDFDLVTEQYWVLVDSYIDVLATTTQKKRPFDPWHRVVTSPAIWTRLWGEGRIFVCTPGHSLDVLEHPSVHTIVERGLLWASR